MKKYFLAFIVSLGVSESLHAISLEELKYSLEEYRFLVGGLTQEIIQKSKNSFISSRKAALVLLVAACSGLVLQATK